MPGALWFPIVYIIHVRQTEHRFHVVSANLEIVARKGMDEKSISRRSRDFDAEASVAAIVRRPRRQHLGACNFPAERGRL